MKYLNITKYEINHQLIEVNLDLKTNQIVFLHSNKILPISSTYYRNSFISYSFDPYWNKRKPELLETRKDKINVKKEMQKHKVYTRETINAINYKDHLRNSIKLVISGSLAFAVSLHSVSVLNRDRNFSLQGSRFCSVIEDYLPNEIFYKQDFPDIDTDALYNEMISIIKNNKNIDEKAKEILINEDVNHGYYKNLIKDYGKYMNINHIKKRLASVKINYNNGKENHETIAAQYNYFINEIKMFCMLEEENYDNHDTGNLLHEFNHLTEVQGLVYGSSLKEAIAEQLKIKYFNEEYHTYDTPRFCGALLEHLVGEDALLRYYYQANMPYLIDKLKEICGNSWDATKLISLIDTINYTELNMLQATVDEINNRNTLYTQNREQYFQARTAAVEEFLNLYSKYYYAKYQKDISEDILVTYYRNKLLELNYPCSTNCIFPGLEDQTPFLQIESITNQYNSSKKIFPQEFIMEVTLNLSGDRWSCHIPLDYNYNADTNIYTPGTKNEDFYLKLAENYWQRYTEENAVNTKGR